MNEVTEKQEQQVAAEADGARAAADGSAAATPTGSAEGLERNPVDTRPAILSIHELDKSYEVDGERQPILRDIDLTVHEGEFVSIVGHSGCGKSTLLKIVAGLVGYDTGEVVRNGRPVTGPDTDCGVVFQEHRLLPWLTIEENIGFGLPKHDRAAWKRAVRDYIRLVHLDGFEHAYPSQLSGGMSQRAAIARGLVTHPKLLLLDEPLGALDAMTRMEMQQELLRIWRGEGTTMVMVTHDIPEAIYLGERVVVMGARPGRIEEIVDIDSPNAKVRGSSDFTYYEQRIYRHFFTDTEKVPEYTI